MSYVRPGTGYRVGSDNRDVVNSSSQADPSPEPTEVLLDMTDGSPELNSAAPAEAAPVAAPAEPVAVVSTTPEPVVAAAAPAVPKTPEPVAAPATVVSKTPEPVATAAPVAEPAAVSSPSPEPVAAPSPIVVRKTPSPTPVAIASPVAVRRTASPEPVMNSTTVYPTTYGARSVIGSRYMTESDVIPSNYAEPSTTSVAFTNNTITSTIDEPDVPQPEAWNTTIDESITEVLKDPATAPAPKTDYSTQYLYGTFTSRVIEDDEDFKPTVTSTIRRPAHEHNSYVDPNTVRESSVFIYKQYLEKDENGKAILKEHPTWRCGPDMKDPRCWLYAPNDANKMDPAGSFEHFEDNQNRTVKSNLDWSEWTDEKWQKIDDHTRVKQRALNPRTAMMFCNPKSVWKHKLDGIYDRHEYETDGQRWGCYSRMVYYRGEPDVPYWPPNERPVTPKPRTPTPPPKEPTPIPPTPTPTPPPKEPTPVPTPTPTPPPPTPTPPPKEPSPKPIVIVAPTPPPPPTPTPPPKEPTPPPKTPTPPPTPTPTPPKLSPLKGAYLYKLNDDGRWRIGPDYEVESAWFFTKDQAKDNAQFYTVDPNTKTIHRSNLTVNPLDGVENVFVSKERTDSKQVSRQLTEDQRGNFIGAWTKIQDDVYVHGPINTKEETKEMTMDQVRAVAPIHVDAGSFTDSFKKASCLGQYDKVSDDLYRRREPTIHEQRDVWAYKVDGRWVIGPDRGSRNCWGYSKKTDKPMTEVSGWYEARIGEASSNVTPLNKATVPNEFERKKTFSSRG